RAAEAEAAHQARLAAEQAGQARAGEADEAHQRRTAAEAAAEEAARSAAEAHAARQAAEEALAQAQRLRDEAYAEAAAVRDAAAAEVAAVREATAREVAEHAAVRVDLERTTTAKLREAESAAASRIAAEGFATVKANEAAEAHELRLRAESAAAERAASADQAHAGRESAEQRLVELTGQLQEAVTAREAAERTAQEAVAARLAAEQAAAAQVMEALEARLSAEEAAVLAQAAREAATQAAKTQADTALAAVRDREEAERRAEEALARASAAAEQAAQAHRLRGEAEDAAAKVSIDRQAVESSIRHNTGLVETALRERLAAERRANELAQELLALRTAVARSLTGRPSKRSLAALQAALETPTAIEPEVARSLDETGAIPAIRSELFDTPPTAETELPPGVGETGQAWLRSAWAEVDSQRSDSSPASADSAPEVADRETEPVTVPAARSFSTAPGADVTVNDNGVLDIQHRGEHHRFDLYDRDIDVRINGRPGQRRWRVELATPGTHPVVVDGKMVDPEAFTREILRWRPEVTRR
ncbi:hypothetical protein, partial [Nocardioides sp.]|uniref:hypothetical protein n=1 Tax=Nocardioides sp. TaxID=35761 RepID=UPI0039E453CC